MANPPSPKATLGPPKFKGASRTKRKGLRGGEAPRIWLEWEPSPGSRSGNVQDLRGVPLEGPREHTMNHGWLAPLNALALAAAVGPLASASLAGQGKALEPAAKRTV